MSKQPLPIEPEDVGRFSIDSSNNLFWDGQRIQTASELKLSPSQSILARIVAVAAICGSLATIANATASWLTYLARRKEAIATEHKPTQAATPPSQPARPTASPSGNKTPQ